MDFSLALARGFAQKVNFDLNRCGFAA